MQNLKDLMQAYAQPGQVAWIGLRGARRVALHAVERVQIGHDGLEGDHGRAGKRAVTLIQSEHLAAIGAMLGRGPVAPGDLRRNLVVSGLNLAALKGREVQIGDAVLLVTGICAPCSRMEEVLGAGGYSAMRSHGGWCAQVLRPGAVMRGSVVFPLA
jgi:MOSC domain-containing protein YiiM